MMGRPTAFGAAKTDAAARDFVQAAGVKINPEASDILLRAIIASTQEAADAEPMADAPPATIQSQN